MNILITGSAGHIARALIPRLLALPDIDQIIGIDTRVGCLEHPRLHNHLFDVRSNNLIDYLYGIDTVIHLAFIVTRQSLHHRHISRALINDINVNGSINLFTAASRAGIRQVIYTSSAMVYAALANNPKMLDENVHRRAMPGSHYSEDKVAVENWLDRFELEQNMNILRLRPSLVIGPHCHTSTKFILRQYFYPFFAQLPLLQCVHESDLVEIIIKALFQNASGCFNIAAIPPLSFRDMLQINHRRLVPIPLLAFNALQRLTGISPGYGEPMTFANLPQSLTIDCSHAADILHWKPNKSTKDCIREINHSG